MHPIANLLILLAVILVLNTIRMPVPSDSRSANGQIEYLSFIPERFKIPTLLEATTGNLAALTKSDDVAVAEQAIEDCGGYDSAAKDAASFSDCAVRGDQRRAALIAKAELGSSTSVYLPLMAATTTLALKAGLWFRRGRLVMVAPALSVSCRFRTVLLLSAPVQILLALKPKPHNPH